eukprot:926508_1
MAYRKKMKDLNSRGLRHLHASVFSKSLQAWSLARATQLEFKSNTLLAEALHFRQSMRQAWRAWTEAYNGKQDLLVSVASSMEYYRTKLVLKTFELWMQKATSKKNAATHYLMAVSHYDHTRVSWGILRWISRVSARNANHNLICVASSHWSRMGVRRALRRWQAVREASHLGDDRKSLANEFYRMMKMATFLRIWVASYTQHAFRNTLCLAHDHGRMRVIMRSWLRHSRTSKSDSAHVVGKFCGFRGRNIVRKFFGIWCARTEHIIRSKHFVMLCGSFVNRSLLKNLYFEWKTKSKKHNRIHYVRLKSLRDWHSVTLNHRLLSHRFIAAQKSTHLLVCSGVLKIWKELWSKAVCLKGVERRFKEHTFHRHRLRNIFDRWRRLHALSCMIELTVSHTRVTRVVRAWEVWTFAVRRRLQLRLIVEILSKYHDFHQIHSVFISWRSFCAYYRQRELKIQRVALVRSRMVMGGALDMWRASVVEGKMSGRADEFRAIA